MGWLVCLLVVVIAALIIYWPHEIVVIIHRRRKRRQTPAQFILVFKVYENRILKHIYLGDAMTPIPITTSQQSSGVSKFLDGATPPNPVPAPAGTTYVWAVDQAALGTITPSDDGTTAVLVAVAVGTVVVSCTATLADGRTFTASQEFDITADLVGFEIDFSAPVPKA